ncbi:MAG TPA: OmpA family protein [Nitrospirota bacterium]|nr:OmpA family protein [Nitrospirota bacterium]
MSIRLFRSLVYVAVTVIVIFTISFIAGCAHMETAPRDRKMPYTFIHKPLPEASRKVDEARATGKDKECPAEFKSAADTVDKAYATYIACHTNEAIAMAQDGIDKINALCPKAAVAAVAVASPKPAPPAPTVSFSADPTSVKQGTCATLTWSSTNASKGSIEPGVGNVEPSGSKQVCPESTTQYTISVAGDGGAGTASTTVSVTPRSPKTMVFGAAALFDVNKSVLKPEGKEQIKAYREQVREALSSASKVKITGYTDSSGTPEYNMKLSLRRAEAVRDYLLGLGVDPKLMEVSGAGMTNPIADNSTKEGRAKNRRVEIEVIGVEK